MLLMRCQVPTVRSCSELQFFKQKKKTTLGRNPCEVGITLD